tara:strand:- start:232 stop:1203 length:972 start_codon:yes stop_codon:yes gene_type:complete
MKGSVWLLVLFVLFLVVFGLSYRKTGFMEGMQARVHDYCDSKTFKTQAERLKCLQGKTVAADFQDQYDTIKRSIANGNEVTDSDLVHLLSAQRAHEYHQTETNQLGCIDDIKKRIEEGKTISESEYNECFYKKQNPYPDNYSLAEYKDRLANIMPGVKSSRRMDQPSRRDMQHGAELDSAFTNAFNASSSNGGSPSSSYLNLGLINSPAQSNMIHNSGTQAKFNLPKPTNNAVVIEGMKDAISRSEIPPGDEDKYILKSKIVPPVCPACPNVCPKEKGECPPCPPCERCPEPNIECKRVANYKTSENQNYPNPVLTDFSQFGM